MKYQMLMSPRSSLLCEGLMEEVAQNRVESVEGRDNLRGSGGQGGSHEVLWKTEDGEIASDSNDTQRLVAW